MAATTRIPLSGLFHGRVFMSQVRHLQHQSRLLNQIHQEKVSSSKKINKPALSLCQVRWFNKIYTKTGDKGTSATFTGVRQPKDYAVFNALGTIDELSSAIGLSAEHSKDTEALHGLMDRLQMIQCMLQDVGSNIATPLSSAREAHLKQVHFNKKFVDELELWIDEMDEELPPLKNFILPGGSKPAVFLHTGRAICRRAERSMASLVRDKEIDPETIKFVNRLSDFLFTAARYANVKLGKEDKIYQRLGDKELHIKDNKH